MGYTGAALVYCVANVAIGAYRHVLVPLAVTVSRGAEAVYAYALVPCDKAIRKVVANIASSFSSVAKAIYINILLPSGKVVVVICNAAGEMIVTSAQRTSHATRHCANQVGLAIAATGAS